MLETLEQLRLKQLRESLVESEDLYVKEICDLLLVWHKLTESGTCWPAAKDAIETRINWLAGQRRQQPCRMAGSLD